MDGFVPQPPTAAPLVEKCGLRDAAGPQAVAVTHRLVHIRQRIKGRSSRLIRQQFPQLESRMPTLLTTSYFVATTGAATLEAVKKYVENQRNV
ncbi:hypothetical protein GCM10010112_93450 [Actinoplanes lobatus]|nr:hypothetical protein GCM10010112_93450 [Actinoplanes lobatus]